MAIAARSEMRAPHSVAGGRLRDWNSVGMEDPDGLLANIAQNIEQLRTNRSNPQEKEFVLKQLFELADAKREARAAIGSHSQAVPLLVSLLRAGTSVAKINAAATLGALCKEEELRMKVLLGGCIPPLLALLRSGIPNAQVAAAQALCAVSQGGVIDQVGAKIFATEGVVPSLWEELYQPERKLDRSVDGLLTGALRNLCNTTEGFWVATLESSGSSVEILVRMLSEGSSEAKANASALLASLLFASGPSGTVSLRSGVIEHLLGLVALGNDTSVRAEAAGALRALSATSAEARDFLVNAGAISILIGAIVAPSKEFMQGKCAQALQENATGALANVSGGMSAVVLSLAESIESCRSDVQMADTIGALAYTLMVFDERLSEVEPRVIEEMLVRQLKARVPQLVQERAIEALASLYGNVVLLQGLAHAEGKKMLVGLVTMAATDVQEELMKSLKSLCSKNEDTNLWRSLRGREGVQLLISLLGLSSEQQQEYAVALLSILSEEADESKWAITAAGGIPPLVQLLETGSAKAREDAALVLSNLCMHSEDIRACVETAEAVPALLWLLKNAGDKGQVIAATALVQLVRESDASTISQLVALLTGDLPESKMCVLDVLGSLLCIGSDADILKEGAAANEAFSAVVSLLGSPDGESGAHSASVLAKVFKARRGLRESRLIASALDPLVELLTSGNERIAMQAAHALASAFLSIKKNHQIALFGRASALPLVELAGSSDMSVAEAAATAFANLLLHSEMAEIAPAEDIISPLTRVLQDGTIIGKGHAACALARLLKFRSIDDAILDSISHSSTVLALVALLGETDLDNEVTLETLEALACLAKTKTGASNRPPLWAVLAEAPYNLGPLVTCLASELPAIQERAVEVLSKLCRDQPVVLGDLIAGTPRCITSLANRVVDSRSLEVRVGAAALLICVGKEHRERSMVALLEPAGVFFDLVSSLVNMLSFKLSRDPSGGFGYDSVGNNARGTTKKREKAIESVFGQVADVDRLLDHDPAAVLGGTVALWLLSIIASFDSKTKAAIMEAGAIEVLTDKLSSHAMTTQDTDENGSIWVSALLLAILFQDRDVTRSPATLRSIPFLSALLKSEEAINCYFAAQAIASLVCNGSRGTLLAVANSGAAGGLIPLLGSAETDAPNLVALSEEFSLFTSPDQVALERLFRADDIRAGATARKAIPALIDLLKPNPERPGAPPLALALLTQLAEGNNANKIAMAEAGILDALTKYLSLGPADAIEEATVDLMSLLFSSPELCRYESAIGAVNQLAAVLRLGTRKARYNAARALQGLFAAEHIKVGDSAKQSIPPLVEMLVSGSEKEQHAAIAALVQLSLENPPKALAITTDGDVNAVEGLFQILSSDCSPELKEDAAELCRVLFANSRVRASPAASNCVQPLVALLYADSTSAQLAGARALDNLLDNEQQADLIAAQGTVVPLVDLVAGETYSLHEAAMSALTKLAKDRPLSKLDMVKAGIIGNVLEIFSTAPDSLCASAAELLRILTNNSSIANSAQIGDVVEPLFVALTRPELSSEGQHSAMQVLVNILEKPQHMANLRLTPIQAVEPLVPLLDSPSQAVQQLSAELLSHLLLQEQFQRDTISQQAIIPLVRIIAMGVPSLQQKAVKALESVSNSWPNAIAEAGGIVELSRVIMQTNPPPSHALWESASFVLANILHFSSQYYLHVPLAVLVQMLRSGMTEPTVVEALSALLVLEREDSSCAEVMTEVGAVEALLELLRCHQCEEAAVRLLEALFNNIKVRETRAAKYAISPLSQYLLDPQTRVHSSRILAALALGDLFQNDALSRLPDAVSACRALVSILEDQPTEEMKMIAACALQNLVMHSKSNKRAVAEAGGVQVVQELLNSSNPETIGQVATLIKLLFSSHTIQEYASSEIIRSLAAALEREFWATGAVNEDIVKAVAVLLGNFPRLRATEAATLCIPQLVGALKAGTEPAQEAALDALCLLKQAWPSGLAEVAKAQAMAAAEAIPLLQLVMRSGPQRFQERADNLLQSLPGSLMVTIVRGHNLKQSMGGTNAFCKLTLGNGPPRQTKVVQHSSSPEWKEGFAWAFDTPPKGLKLHLACKNKGAFGKGSLGKVTIQIDRVVMLGTINGQYTLTPDKNRDGTSRSLEIEFQWSNR